MTDCHEVVRAARAFGDRKLYATFALRVRVHATKYLDRPKQRMDLPVRT